MAAIKNQTVAILAVAVGMCMLACAHAWTCDGCGVKDCCPSSMCSTECRARGKTGGYCKYNSLENRCICYCTSSAGNNTVDIVREELLEEESVAHDLHSAAQEHPEITPEAGATELTDTDPTDEVTHAPPAKFDVVKKRNNDEHDGESTGAPRDPGVVVLASRRKLLPGESPEDLVMDVDAVIEKMKAQKISSPNDCEYAASAVCTTWEQCKQGCAQYNPEYICLLGTPGASSGCCVCDISCNSNCEWGWCPCAMGCGCR